MDEFIDMMYNSSTVAEQIEAKDIRRKSYVDIDAKKVMEDYANKTKEKTFKKQVSAFSECSSDSSKSENDIEENTRNDNVDTISYIESV